MPSRSARAMLMLRQACSSANVSATHGLSAGAGCIDMADTPPSRLPRALLTYIGFLLGGCTEPLVLEHGTSRCGKGQSARPQSHFPRMSGTFQCSQRGLITDQALTATGKPAEATDALVISSAVSRPGPGRKWRVHVPDSLNVCPAVRQCPADPSALSVRRRAVFVRRAALVG
jgi:hypothetical protein